MSRSAGLQGPGGCWSARPVARWAVPIVVNELEPLVTTEDALEMMGRNEASACRLAVSPYKWMPLTEDGSSPHGGYLMQRSVWGVRHTPRVSRRIRIRF